MGHLQRGSGRLSSRPGLHDDQRARSILRQCSVFAVLAADSMAELSSVSRLVSCPRRRPLYPQGEQADTLYALGSGRVRVVRETGHERALTVAYRVGGDLVGETAVVAHKTYQEAATSIEPVEAVAVPIARVKKLLASDAGFGYSMLRLMVERRLEAERRIESLLSRTVESRVAEFLIDAADRHGIPESRGILIGVKYTHQEIADFVGSTRETVTVTLGDLKRRAMILYDHRRVVVTHLDNLAGLV